MSTSGEWLKNCRRRVCPLAQETMMHARVHEPPSWTGRGCWHEKMNSMSLTASRGLLESF